MSMEQALPLLVIASSLLTAIVIFLLREEQVAVRTAMNIGGAVVKLVLVAILAWGSFRGIEYETRIGFVPGAELVFRVDFLALLFVALSSVLWLLTTIYAIGYLEGSPHRSRFFGFFSLCVTATMGIALAGNLLTFFVFYEALTVVTFPLVVHRGTGAALNAGRTYLLYTLFGGVLLLLGIAALNGLVGAAEFAPGGQIAHLVPTHAPELILIFALMIGGLGVKAALVPLHGWLPQAMVAPAPVSALLHAVAVVKAGAFGIVRVVYDVFGIESAAALGVLGPLAAVAAVSILYGSVLALQQQDLKRRLAYSTVSQLSYITLGVALVGPLATTGALAHLVHQGVMKITLFLCAGVVAETLGIHKIREMAGIGRRLPLTMLAFSVAAVGMIGLPPTAGFISKWYLGLGGLAAGSEWVVVLLVLSGVLNAMYFLPIIGIVWFRAPEKEWSAAGGHEANLLLLIPTLITAALALAAGLLPGMPFGPLWLAHLAVDTLYAP
jgi:multicomponent Na+:H+ antiporter subunit D